MPASLTRTCPRCHTERRTPHEFQDAHEAGKPGRPPRICRFCREDDPALQARYEDYKATRPAQRIATQAKARRTDVQVLAARTYLRPSGMKTCPEVAGCGQALPFDAFGPDRHQPDGLHQLCDSCVAEHEALRRNA